MKISLERLLVESSELQDHKQRSSMIRKGLSTLVSETGDFVTRLEAPGWIRSSSGGWPTILLQYSDAVGWVFDL